jgi:DNA-binding NarL/FixJ family response regulator
MRVSLAGPSAERETLRRQLVRAGLEVTAEFATLAAARSSPILVDAIVIALPADDRPGVEDPLTSREVQVLELLAEGLSNKSIAARLAISDQTVKFHVASICGKLGALNRTDALRRAIRRGLVTV